VCGAPLRNVQVAGGSLTGTTDPSSALGASDIVVIPPDGQPVVLKDAFECHEAVVTIQSFRVAEAAPTGASSRFEWQVAHDEGDEALSCTLDPGDDSQPYEISDCLGVTSHQHTYLEGGSVTALLTARDANGQGANRELTFVVGLAPP